MGQNVDLTFDNITSIIGQARAGAISRSAFLWRSARRWPEFRPIAETVPGCDTTSCSGVAMRAGTRRAICDKIEVDTKIICQDAVLKETDGTGAANFSAYVASEQTKSGKLIMDLKLRVE